MSSNSGIHVFAGPTIGASEIEKRLPGCTIRPPAKHGDIIIAVREGAEAIVLIDGLFHQVRSVKHKEIMLALNAGLSVIGASSMGALRAAELSDYGMVGVGQIYEAYRSGKIAEDADVVLSHGPAPDYLPMTVPMVNLVYIIDRLVAIGLLTRDERDSVESLGRRLHYTDRDWFGLREAAKPGLEHLVQRVHEVTLSDPAAFDAKRSDAIEALERCASWHGAPPRLERTQGVPIVSRHLADWIIEGTPNQSTSVRRLDLLRFEQILDPKFPTRWAAFVRRELMELTESETFGDVAHRFASERADLSAAQWRYWFGDCEQTTDATERLLVRSYWPADGVERLLAPSSLLVDEGEFALASCASALQTNEQVLQSLGPSAVPARLNEERIRTWLVAEWGTRPGLLRLAAFERGLRNEQTAIDVARNFFLWRVGGGRA